MVLLATRASAYHPVPFEQWARELLQASCVISGCGAVRELTNPHIFYQRRRLLSVHELPLAERELRVYSDESYVHANHAGKTTWGLSEKAWQDAVHQDAVEKIAAGQDLSKTHIDMAGLADGGAKTPLVRQARITSRRQMTVIVDMISEHGRVHRT
jgi:hypothetical protein